MNVNIADIAALAQLELTPEEASAMQRDLAAILDYVAQLDRIDTHGVEPLAHLFVGDGDATLRDDAARSWFTSAEALANAPAARDGMFEVPKILERG